VKTGPDALGNAENASGSAKRENGTRRPRNAENASGRAKRENGTVYPENIFLNTKEL